jgi:hypothetical protein
MRSRISEASSAPDTPEDGAVTAIVHPDASGFGNLINVNAKHSD